MELPELTRNIFLSLEFFARVVVMGCCIFFPFSMCVMFINGEYSKENFGKLVLGFCISFIFLTGLLSIDLIRLMVPVYRPLPEAPLVNRLLLSGLIFLFGLLTALIFLLLQGLILMDFLPFH